MMLVRIVNKLRKKNYAFQVEPHFVSHSLIQHLLSCTNTIVKPTRDRSRSRDKMIEYKWENSNSYHYVKISNLPSDVTKPDITLFLKGIDIKYEVMPKI